MSALAGLFAVAAGGGILQGLMARKDMAKQNKAIARQNLAQTMQAQESMLAVELQKSFVKQQSAQTMHTARRVASQEAGGQTAMAAAAGVRGASVDAVQNDIQRELGEAIDSARADAVMQEFNLNQQIKQIATSTRLNLTPYHDIPSIGQTLVRGLLSGGIQAGSAYAASRFKFGA